MKKLSIASITILFTGTLSAQTADEWFRQNKTQKKYLAQQIAALHIYAGYLSKGYAVVKDGLHTIQNIRRGDLKLHADYFASLSAVNPKIKRYAKVADILSVEVSIAKHFREAAIDLTSLVIFENNFILERHPLKIICR